MKKKFFFKFGHILASFAIMIVSLNVNTACMFFMYQPELPQNADKLRKY